MRVAGRSLTTAQLTVEVAGQPVAVTVIRSSNRRRTIAVGIGPGGIRVQAPVATSESAVLELLQQRQAWLVRHLQADSLRKSALELATGSRMLFRGEHLTLRVETVPGRRVRVTRIADVVVLQVPAAMTESERSAAVERAILSWYRKQAVEVLPALVDRWAAICTATPERVIIRDQRRRWGSCGPDGTIRLNWRLILLAPPLADYVVVHELAHLRHRHHQAAFWEEVARYIPDHRERRKQLNGSGALGYLAR